ncbi:hypothetical protein D3C85_1790370 [compost metagenome]
MALKLLVTLSIRGAMFREVAPRLAMTFSSPVRCRNIGICSALPALRRVLASLPSWS